METTSGSMLETLLHRSRWSFIVRGIIAIAFGIFVFIWPLHALGVLILLFGIFAIANGLVAVMGAVQSFREHGHGWALAISGVLSVLAGIIALVWPRETALILFMIIAIWAIITGVVEIGLAFSFRHLGADAWIMAATGIISILFGFLLLLSPAMGLLALVWVIGVYAVLYGILLISRASFLHDLEKSSEAERT